MGATVLTTAALSACGGGDSSGPASVAAPTSSMSTSTFSSAASGPSTSPHSTAPTPVVTVTKKVPATSKAAARRAGVPASAYPGAGGARPAGAKLLTEVLPTVPGAVGFHSKTGKLGCSASGGRVDCRNANFTDGDGTLGGPVSVTFENGVVGRGFSTDYAGFENPDSLTLADGAMRYLGNVVFVSDDKGLTVWDTSTGHGVFMNNQETTTF